MSVKVLGDGPKPPMQCPDPDRIAAYLDDGLFEEERRTLEEHFASCEDCWQIFSNAVEYIAQRRAQDVAAGVKPEDERTVRAFPWLRHGKGTAVAAALAVVVGGGSWMLGRNEGSPRAATSGHQVAALPALERAVPSRVIGVAWGPLPDPDRGIVAHEDPRRWREMQRLDEALRAAEKDASAPQLRHVGSAYLRVGQVDPAVAALERAAAAAQPSAGTLSDLAAAYLARGLDDDNVDDIAHALETAMKALEIEPRLIPARFNRALALDSMPLRGRAIQAWRDYLDVDGQSRWAEEARRQLAALERGAAPVEKATTLRKRIIYELTVGDEHQLSTLVTNHRQETREAFQLDLLPTWAAAIRAGNGADARQTLDHTRRLAELWEDETGDGSLLLQSDEIARASPAEAKRFALGLPALAKGMEALEAMEVEAARTAFAQAQTALPPKSTSRAWADVFSLACEYYRVGADDTVLAQFDDLAAQMEQDLPLGAYLSWLRGVLRFQRGDPESLSLLEEALATFNQLEESDHVTWLNYVLADAHALFGNLPKAWEHRRRSLRGRPLLRRPDRGFEILLAPAIAAAYLEDRPRVAVELLEELAQGSPLTARQSAELDVWRAQVELQLGRRTRAREKLSEAAVQASRIADLTVRQRVEYYVVAGEALAAESGADGIATLSSAIAAARRHRDFRFPGLLRARARAYRDTGDLTRSASDLREAIAWLAGPAGGSVMGGIWSKRLAGGDALFDDLVSLEAAAGRSSAAFAVAEQDREWGSGVPELVRQGKFSEKPTGETRPSVEQLAARMEAGTALLFFSLTRTDSLLWRVDSAGSRGLRLRATPSELRAWAVHLQTDLANGVWTPQTEKVARQLYASLIAPAQLGPNVRRLIIVPDPALDQLPFAALLDARANRFLVEQRALVLAPSVGAYLGARSRADDLKAAVPSVLALGNPQAGAGSGDKFPALPAAAKEATEVFARYEHGESRLAERATREVLLERAGRYTVVHFAGHAVANSIDPARASLVLAPTPGSAGSGALFAFEVSSASFARTRLVVLAGCSTGRSAARAGVGASSLAHAFLAAKVPSVVASLWPVKDGRTAEMMVRFHERIARGQDPVTALRDAQLAMLSAPNPELRSPATWAAFGVLGS